MIAETEALTALYSDSPLFAGLDEQARSRLRELSTVRHYEPGATLVNEGESDPYLYVITRGRVRIAKRASQGEDSHALVEFGVGQTMGEEKIVAPAPAIATVTVLEPLDLVCIDLDRMRSEPDFASLRAALLLNITHILSVRLRGASEMTVEAMQAELAQSRLRESSGRFLVYLFAVMSGFSISIAALNDLGSQRPPQMLISAVLVISAVIPMALLQRRSAYAPSTFGLTLDRWMRVVGQAVLYTLPMLAILTLAKVAWIYSGPAHRAEPLFQPGAIFEGPFKLGPWLAAVVAYCVLSSLQEFFARSGLQGLMELFIPRSDGKTNWKVILLANMMFAAAHAYLGLRFVLAAFLPGFFWGWLFHRQRSLLGVAVSHSLFGIWALFVLGLQVIVGGH